MELWTKILQIFDTRMETPASYGWFHWLWLGIMVAASVFVALRGRKMQQKTVINIVLVMAIVAIVLEIYKQINFTFGDGSSSPAYHWYAFPWQFCSTPMYIGLLAGLIRKGRVHDALCAYLATFAMFAGLAVMIYPNDVYMEVIGINIQTMICHGGMVVIAVLLLVSGHVQIKLRTLWKAVPVFVATLTVAMVLNEVAYRIGLLENHNFNMFYISPYLEGSLPVYSQVQAVVPYPWSLAMYVLGFTAAAGIMLAGAKGVKCLARRKKPAAAASQQPNA